MMSGSAHHSTPALRLVRPDGYQHMVEETDQGESHAWDELARSEERHRRRSEENNLQDHPGHAVQMPAGLWRSKERPDDDCQYGSAYAPSNLDEQRRACLEPPVP